MSDRPEQPESRRPEPDDGPREPAEERVEDLDVADSDSEHVKGGSLYQWWKKVQQ
jgi:hypothetical protein